MTGVAVAVSSMCIPRYLVLETSGMLMIVLVSGRGVLASARMIIAADLALFTLISSSCSISLLS